MKIERHYPKVIISKKGERWAETGHPWIYASDVISEPEDLSEKNKVNKKVNSILDSKEKARYKNIGIAFFEGAKDAIIGIFKQIEKNKSKSLIRKGASAVKEIVSDIKEKAEEHKTGMKILAAIALIGGIYYMFKDWFDEKMPPIWEKIKEAFSGLSSATRWYF